MRDYLQELEYRAAWIARLQDEVSEVEAQRDKAKTAYDRLEAALKAKEPKTSSLSDFIKIDWESLRAARKKQRQLNIEIEQQRSYADLQHTSYKLGQFLAETLGPAWDAVEEKAPEALP